MKSFTFYLIVFLTVALSTTLTAQNTKIQLTKAIKADKQGAFEIYQVQFKVLSGEISDQNTNEFSVIQNGAIKAYAYFSSTNGKLTAGQSPKYDEYVYVLGSPLAVGQTLVSHDLATPTLPANRLFSFKTDQAFLGTTDKEFFGSISDVKGILKVGDAIEYQNFKGQRAKAKITGIEITSSLHPKILIEGLPSDVMVSISIVSESNADFSKAAVTSLGNLPASNKQPTSTTTAKITGKTQIIPANVVLKNDEIKITVHNLIKFNPDPATSQSDVFKVDYSLDYYIVDATVENISKHEIDAGEYLTRFNFFSPDGKSADEFLRLFKKENAQNDDVQKQAELIDKMALGGTSKIKLAAIMVKYQEMLPDFEQKHKPILDQLYQKMAPGQQLHSVAATLMGVPPSYKIEGLGTWKGTFFNQKNLIFTPLKR
jgi:hypothetical protein